MKSKIPLLCALSLSVLGSIFLAGCASEASMAQARKEKAAQQAAVASGQYVWSTPVGSSIPVLIPKDQAKASAAETEQTQNVFRDVQRSGQRAESDK